MPGDGHLDLCLGRGHALIDRALYLPEARAADGEYRELAGIPEEVMFATKPQLADELLERAHQRGIRAAFVAGDEVCGGRELRQAIRSRAMGHVLAVRVNATVTPCPGTTITAAGAVNLIPDRAWQRLRAGSGTKGARMATPPPAPRTPGSPALERLRRGGTVRAFARARLAGHPARDDAVLVASEIVANSVAHSASGQDGGWILVHLAEFSATHAAVLITEQRGSAEPVVMDAGPDAESGRGLAIVRSLSTFFRVSEARDARAILAVVPAGPPGDNVRRCTARTARRLRLARRAAKRITA